ncbi:MAG: extracellular solute-binding protein [Demequinaceae bacterium]|nr:extracellular solute-binding protein [Demequinaceae bacterium]
MGWNRKSTARILAAGTAVAIALSGCESAPELSGIHTDGPLVITIGAWEGTGIAGDEAGAWLESEYESTHPWIDIQVVSGDFFEQHDMLQQALIDGSGAYSIAIVDDGYIAGFVAQSDRFVNLLDLGAGEYEDDYLAWKWGQAATADGSAVIGLGNDVGGLALCYRSDLFEAAGLPSDRDDVSAALGDSWDDFIAFGEGYVAATGKHFIDNATNVMNPAVMQLGTGHAYYDRNDQLDMRNVKPAFDTALDVIEAGLSSYTYWRGHEAPNQAAWNTALSSDDFAVVLCPSSMLAEIESQVPADFEGQWDIADIPGPGGNWGGSFFTIPKQGTAYEQQEAYSFLEWLIQPEQQIAIMENTGRLPSLISILEGREISSLTNEFFNDAPYGEVYAKAVLDVPAPVYHSRCEADVRAAVEDYFNRLQAGNVILIDPWDVVLSETERADQC